MKKLFIVWMALIFALSSAGLTLAQEKAKKEEPAGVSRPATTKSAEGVKAEEVQGKGKAAEKEHVSAKPYLWRMGGLVTAVDGQAKTLSLHQETVDHDWVMKLRVSEKVAKELLNIKPGDLVNVWVNGKVITALNKVA
jgi:hypothetical protein